MNEKDTIEKVETLRGAEAPNQMALELLKAAKDINQLVVVIRDHSGKLRVEHTDQDFPALVEAAVFLMAQVQHDCFTVHANADDECDEV